MTTSLAAQCCEKGEPCVVGAFSAVAFAPVTVTALGLLWIPESPTVVPAEPPASDPPLPAAPPDDTPPIPLDPESPPAPAAAPPAPAAAPPAPAAVPPADP